MSDFDDKSALTISSTQSQLLSHPADCGETLDPLTLREIVAVREFFELLAKWGEEDPSYGN
jgi:hypothetical protein